MRKSLQELSGRRFEVAVVGAGANGASAAQHLAAAGYEVLLVDKDDFAAGSSSRSSRLLHCGLRYLAPGASILEFVRHPRRFATACRMAKAAMECRAELVGTMPERVRALTFCFPLYRDGPYAPWQVDAAFRLLRALGPRDVPLDYRRLSAREALAGPLTEHLRDPGALAGVASFREYQFEWPERIALDAVLDAERLGACVRNYTAVSALERDGDSWRLTLADRLQDGAEEVTVDAGVVCNMAGIWIDRVNAGIRGGRARRRITGTKGAHIVVQLPPECESFGIVTLNRRNEPFYCIPWRGLHYFGPTETLYEGDPDDVRPTEADFAFLLDEANHLLPGLELARADVIYGWAGVRPLTYDPALPMGARSRELHDFAGEGLPNLLAMTAGPVMTHRSAGRAVARKVSALVPARGSPAAPSYAASPMPCDPDSPPLSNRDRSIRLADVRHAVGAEHAERLADVLFRRLGVGWSPDLGRDVAAGAARVLGEARGWSEARIEAELRDYLVFVERQYLLPTSGDEIEDQRR